MLGGLFARGQASRAPPPPKLVEPPTIPSHEKRQEKERRWMESITHRDRRGNRSGATSIPLPAPVEHIKKVDNSDDRNQQQRRLLHPASESSLLDKWTHSHRRNRTAGSSSSSVGCDGDSGHASSTTGHNAGRLRATLMRSLSRKQSRRDVKSSTEDHSSRSSSSTQRASAAHRMPRGSSGSGDYVHVPPASLNNLLAPPVSLSKVASPHSHSHGILLPPLDVRQTSSARNLDSLPLARPSTLYASKSSDTSIPDHHPGHASSSQPYLPLPSTPTRTRERQADADSPKALAARLAELENAHAVGLLNDEEYRVLRRNLFEKSLKSAKAAQNPAPGSHPQGGLGLSAINPHSDANDGQRTGTLLGLRRLNMVEGDTRAPQQPAPPPAPAEFEAPSQLLPPSSSSTRSKSGRFSVRSGRSNLTSRSTASRFSNIFRRAGSSLDPSSQSGGVQHPPMPSDSAHIGRVSDVADANSMTSVPVSLSRKKTSRFGKSSIPSDWRALPEQHEHESQRQDSKLSKQEASGLIQPSTLYGDEENLSSDVPVESRYRTMRSGSMTTGEELPFNTSTVQTVGRNGPYGLHSSAPPTHTANALPSSHSDPVLSEYLRNNPSTLPRIPSATFDVPPVFSLSTNTPEGGLSPSVSSRSGRNGSLPAPQVQLEHSDSRMSPKESVTITAPRPAALQRKMSIMQPSDELLDSRGIQKAIEALKKENARVLEQFSDLEASLAEKLGAPLTDSAHLSQRRRDSLAAQVESLRRLSSSSSTTSRSAAGHSSLPPLANTLDPTLAISMSRRPSGASSIASSSMRRGISGSTYLGSQETHATTRPPSTVQEELLEIVDDDGMDNLLSASMTSPNRLLGNPKHEKELQEFQDRRKDVEERYAARLEYLEARLKSQLLKEKLRR